MAPYIYQSFQPCDCLALVAQRCDSSKLTASSYFDRTKLGKKHLMPEEIGLVKGAVVSCMSSAVLQNISYMSMV